MGRNLTDELSTAMKETISLINSASESNFNKVPFKSSWTAAQTARHLVKAGSGMAQMFATPAPLANRQPDEKAEELKNILLDFDRKMEAPGFIIPEDKVYTKQELVKDTERIREETLKVLTTAKLDEVPEMQEGNPLKGYTKLELLHFAIYHTQRHNRQIQKILEANN